MKNIIVSGYFAPLHLGHLDYLRAAKAMGDRLFVIVNSDKQTIMKGSIPFMDEKTRYNIVKNLKCVDNTLISIDNDSSVSKSIEYIHQVYHERGDKWWFVNGGDRSFAQDIHETGVCCSHDIEIKLGVGGTKKTDSSSKIIERAARKWISNNHSQIDIITITKYIKSHLYDKLSLDTKNELNKVLHNMKQGL